MADGAQCESTKRVSHVEVQIDQLGNAIEAALGIKSGLEARLSCILRSEPPIVEGLEKEKGIQPLVPLAEHLADLNRKMIILNQRLDSILNRIEL